MTETALITKPGTSLATLVRNSALAIGALFAASLFTAAPAHALDRAVQLENRNAEAPQAPTGERIEKQKGPRAGGGAGGGAGGQTIVGQWQGTYSWSTGAGGPLDLNIAPGGQLQAGDFLPWSWEQRGNSVTFTEESGNRWTGTLSGDTISGTMRRFDGTANGTFEFRRVGGGGGAIGGQGEILGDWEVTIFFPSTGASTFVQTFSANGRWLEDGADAGQWRREGNEFVWTWGEFGSGRMNFRATINGDQGAGQTNGGYQFQMVRVGGGGAAGQPAVDLGPEAPVGTWRGRIVWHGANTIDLDWIFGSDGTIVTEFGEAGTWERTDNRGGFRGAYRGNGANDMITFTGRASRGRITGTIHSDFEGGYDGTINFTSRR